MGIQNTECVVIKGWVESPRHCYGEDRNHALLGKKYVCKIRAKAGDKPFGFRGYDKAVIDKSNDYIKMVWRKTSYDVSHRAAISWNVLERLKSDMLQSMSACGFREAILEATKNYHLRLSVQWRAYVDSLTSHRESTKYINLFMQQQLKQMRQYYPAYDSIISLVGLC